MADALAQAEELIPCEVRMISGCKDEQTSADGTFRILGLFDMEIMQLTDLKFMIQLNCEQYPMLRHFNYLIQPVAQVVHVQVQCCKYCIRITKTHLQIYPFNKY